MYELLLFAAAVFGTWLVSMVAAAMRADSDLCVWRIPRKWRHVLAIFGFFGAATVAIFCCDSWTEYKIMMHNWLTADIEND